MASIIIEQSIPLVLENLKEMPVTIWKADHTYIILFLFWVLIYCYCNKVLKNVIIDLLSRRY